MSLLDRSIYLSFCIDSRRRSANTGKNNFQKSINRKKGFIMASRKFTTYLEESQIDWLRQTALKESKSRGYEVTAAQLLRELIDKEKLSQK